MGCASSSPLINGGGPGGVVEAAQHAASDVVHAGENALHDVGEQMKGAMVGAVNNVGQGIGDLFGNGKTDENKLTDNNSDDNNYKYIPLKDPKQTSVDENLENFKNDLLKKAKSFSEDADKMADDLMNETSDVITDAGNDMMSTMDEIKKEIIDDVNATPIHSLDSMKTEPEIERILANDTNPPTPVPDMEEPPITDEILTIVDNQIQDIVDVDAVVEASSSVDANGDAGDSNGVVEDGNANQQENISASNDSDNDVVDVDQIEDNNNDDNDVNFVENMENVVVENYNNNNENENDDEDFRINDEAKFIDDDEEDDDYIPTAWEQRADVVEGKPKNELDLFSLCSSEDLFDGLFTNTSESRALSRKNSLEIRNENLARNLKQVNETVDNLIRNWVEKDYINKHYLTRSFNSRTPDVTDHSDNDHDNENGGDRVNSFDFEQLHDNIVEPNPTDDDIEILDKIESEIDAENTELQGIEE